ncbi:hypothetical protein CBR_g55459 [Chara braunii]|uniref:Uncharacterized protein n=1 Tax=Chara braunii TaxID=69332 RepID=A0A388K7S7_CHABU|nr:hypothetical protein CBR_g55459 [Chara braunii]|eukprot:GBG66115.1 hypothetical protein CBR_g55459 [Chara braunii]
MSYKISRSLKRQVQIYRFVEVVESGTGFLVLTILTVQIGCFHPDMPSKILWTCIPLLLLGALAKLLRGFIHGVYFEGMSCAQVARREVHPCPVIVGSFTVLGGAIRSTFAYVALSALVRLCAMVAEVSLGVFLYRAIPELKGHPDYDKDLGLKHVHEFLVVTCVCLSLHSVLMGILVFFGLAYACLRFCLTSLKRLFDVGGCCRTCRQAEPLRQTADCPFWERLERARAETQKGITWYVHESRHVCFSAIEAHAHKEVCGLPGFWFHSVEELVDMEEDEEGYVWQTKSCDCELFAAEDMLDHMQDLPQSTRCRHDVDAGLEFARARGYLTMLHVIKCCPAESEDIELAASILAGFASGLSVLPWQPYPARREREGDLQHFILEMLEDDDFRYITLDLLHEFRCRIVGRTRCPTTICGPPTDCYTASGGNASPVTLRATTSALNSFAQAASDIHAHLHGHQRPRTQPKTGLTRDVMKSGDEVDTGYARKLSNAYTTQSPVGWLLQTTEPDFQRANDVWVNSVRSELMAPDIVDALLDLASKSDNWPCNVVADAIRTLSALWSRRMITWHRFDDRLLEHFPPPMASIDQLDNQDNIQKKLKGLVRLFSDPEVHPQYLPGTVFSKLHLAKILISQGIRDIDEEVAEMLLQCLCYWKRALGPREVDWLTCEVIETLRDLFVTSTEKSALQSLIRRSAGEVNCLRLMLSSRVSAMRGALFFATDPGIFDNRLLHDLSHSEVKEKTWSTEIGTHKNNCVAAAAGLLAELISSPEVSSALLPKPSDNPAFYRTLFMSLSSILHLEAMQIQRDLANASSSLKESASRPSTIYLTQLNFSARFVLLFGECLGNPAWRPAFGLLENISSSLEEGAENRMEHKEREVNVLLATRYAVMIAVLVLTRYPGLVQSHFDHHLLSTCFPPFVQLLMRPFPRLQRCSRLQVWEDELHSEIRNGAAQVLLLILPRVYQLELNAASPSASKNSQTRLHAAESSPIPLNSVGIALGKLQKWAALQSASTNLELTRHSIAVIERSTGIANVLELVKESSHSWSGLYSPSLSSQESS